MALALGLVACGNKKTDADGKGAPMIEKSDIKVDGGLMTPEVLWAFGRLSDAKVSADGKKIVYGVSYYSVEQNKSNRELFVVNTDGSDNKQITRSAKSENAAKWVKNDSRIAFLSSESGSSQIWEMNPDGSDRTQITDREGGINDFIYSPDNKKILFVADVKYAHRTSTLTCLRQQVS